MKVWLATIAVVAACACANTDARVDRTVADAQVELRRGQVAAAQKLVISNWDAYMPPDFLQNFTKETGIQTEISLHATNEEIMGKLSASGGQGFDVVFVSSPFAEALHKQGMVAELDHSKIPNLKNLYDEARKLGYDPGNTFSVPYTWGTTGLCYRSDLVKGDLTSWRDLLQPTDDLKGKITIGVGDVALRDAVHQALNGGARNILVNLNEVTTIDSSGVGELVSTYTTVTNRGGKLKLLSLPPKVADILQITQLITVFEVFDSEAEAVASF